MSWTKHVPHPSEVVKKGDDVDVVYEGMNLEMKVMVDPIHRRIVLGVTNIPAEQPPRPAEPSKVESMDSLENPPPPPANYDIDDVE